MQQGGPQTNQTEGLSGYIISRLTQGFSFRCLRFARDVAASRARFASGWRAAPLPGGNRTLWIASKGFRLHPSSFPGLRLSQGRNMPTFMNLLTPDHYEDDVYI